MVLRGFCNKCGQCCGLDNGYPAFPWGMFDVCRQYETSPDADLNTLSPAQVKLYHLVKDAFGREILLTVAGQTLKVMVLADERYRPYRGLVRSESETYCPFLDVQGNPDPDAPAGVAHGCLVWGEDWQVELCQGMPPFTQKVGQEITEEEEEQARQFLEDHPKCGFYLEAR